MVPVAVMFLKPDISLFVSTRTNLAVVTVPGVNPFNLFISAADEVTKVPLSIKPVAPSWLFIFTFAVLSWRFVAAPSPSNIVLSVDTRPSLSSPS